MARDYYNVLGVSRDASTEEIKKSFRRLARDTHPDANPGDPAAEARFREIAEAYEVLSDPGRRRRYDRGDSIDLGDLFSTFGAFDDLLRSVFGDAGFGATRRPQARGHDVLVADQVTLADAAVGVDREMTFHTAVRCETCTGSGLAEGAAAEPCPRCEGSGAIRVARQSLLGSVMSVTTCDLCGGSGELIRNPCPTCQARGVVEGERSVVVEIPAGVADGNRLRLSGEGAAGPRDSLPGDLFVEIRVLDDERFLRDGDNLIYELEVGIAEASLGTEVEVPLIDGGIEELRLSAGTQPGAIFRLPGEGMGRLGRRGRGDLLVHVDVTIPESLTKEEEELLTRFAELRGESISPRRKFGRRR